MDLRYAASAKGIVDTKSRFALETDRVQPDEALLHGPFAHDFGEVWLPGEVDPIPLTPVQSALMRVLWKRNGRAIDRETLLHSANVDLPKPVDAFPKNKYPDANRAYHALVCSDRQGRYWLSRE